jgi:CheY-like chemotaxis protein/HPt (histidine-containing phosphotransfer) domain-containing protein
MEFALEVLRKAGYQVDTAMDGRSALEAATRKPYDVILMDCQMPDMDGLEATRKIREKEQADTSTCGLRNKRVPIIALTANALKEDRKQCLEGGMTDYLSKPIAAAKLIEMVDRYAGCTEAKPTSPRAVAKSQPCEAAPSAAPGDSKTSPFDIEALLQRCNGSREFMMRILAKFNAKMPGILTELEQGIRAGKSEHVGLLAHTLKGMASNLAAESLRTAAFELEQLAKEGELDEAAASLQEIRHEYQRCQEDMAETMSQEQARDEGTDR